MHRRTWVAHTALAAAALACTLTSSLALGQDKQIKISVRGLLARLKNYWNRFTRVEKTLLLFLFLLILGSWIFSNTYGRRYTTLIAKAGGTYTEGLVGQPDPAVQAALPTLILAGFALILARTENTMPLWPSSGV